MEIFFSVGEPSGDLHGANLIRELQRERPDVECVGYGGPRMAGAGFHPHHDLTQLAVMWLVRVAANLPVFWHLVSRADRYFHHHRPDAVVLIDYPGFNWWIARRAKAHGIPVFYYGVPQLWAWAGWRIRKMRRFVDHVLCKLPFEADWYRERGCTATYVGHPYFDELRARRLDQKLVEQLIIPSSPLVTILPGSRIQEVTSNLRPFLESAQRILRQVPDTRFAVAAYQAKHAELVRKALASTDLPVTVHVGKTPELIHAATCCMAVSGSVSLELLYHAKPTVILYQISRLAYWLQGFFRKVKYITLVNLLASEDPFPDQAGFYDPTDPVDAQVPMPEYLTYRDRSAQIAAHVIEWLTDPTAYRKRVEQLQTLSAVIDQGGASNRAAKYILDNLNRRPVPLPQPHAHHHAA